MELRRLLRRVFDLPPPVWRSFGFVGLFIGLSLSCASSATVAAVSPWLFSPRAQETTKDSATGSARAAGEAEGFEQERRITRRLQTVALIGGALLLLLAFGYGYLRLELTTRGFYSGRLQTAAGIASISVVTAAYFLWRWLVN